MYITPLRWSGGGNKKKFSLLPKEGPRLPPLAALGWIIAYYVEFGKIRGTDCRVGALPLLAMTGRGMRALSAPCGAPPPRGEARGAVGRNPPSAFGGVPPLTRGADVLHQ